MKQPSEDSDCTSDLSQWFHCANNKGIPDTILSQSWDITKTVSFVFHHRSNNAVAGAANTIKDDEDMEKDDDCKMNKRKRSYDSNESDGNDDEEDGDYVPS